LNVRSQILRGRRWGLCGGVDLPFRGIAFIELFWIEGKKPVSTVLLSD
jgi:hypothetical protein